MATHFNSKNSAVRRILQELREFQNDRNPLYDAGPVEDNLFEWHFTIRGQIGTEFEGGIYHGRILLPSDYPLKPPNIVILTPNGRFVVGQKICLSISGHHPEEWQPAWSIRTALIALISFMPTEANGAIGSLDYPESKRRELAQKSISWECERCNKKNWDILAGTSPKQEKKSPAESTGKENERMQEVTQAADDCSLSKAARVDMPTTRDSESARTRPDLDARAGSVRHIVAPPVEVHPAARIRLLDAIIAAILLMLLAILCQKFVV